LACDQRKKEIETFIQRNQRAAYALALSITDNPFQADWVVSDTNLELWNGQLREEFYFLAIKRNALNLIEKLSVEQDIYVPLENCFRSNDIDEDEPLAPDQSGPEPGGELGLKGMS